MSDTIDSLLADFGRTMGALAVPTDHGGTIPKAYLDYHAFEATRANLNATAEQVATGIEDLMSSDDPRLTPEMRDGIVRQNSELWDIANAQGARDLKANLSDMRAGLDSLFASKVVELPSVDQQLARQDIEMALAAEPRATRTAVLMNLITQDPARFGPVLMSGFGKSLLGQVNEGENHPAMVRHALDMIPDTKVSAHARAALQALPKVAGLVGHIAWTANQRVEAARGAKRAGLVSESGFTRNGRV
jgi:hypothetical protein